VDVSVDPLKSCCVIGTMAPSDGGTVSVSTFSGVQVSTLSMRCTLILNCSEQLVSARFYLPPRQLSVARRRTHLWTGDCTRPIIITPLNLNLKPNRTESKLSRDI
jgi:hypothetical protein